LACALAQAFNLLSVLIERLADGVAPFADGLLALLSQVWRSGEGQSLLRAQACLSSFTCCRAVHSADCTCIQPLCSRLR